MLRFHASTHWIHPHYRHHVALSGISIASAGVVDLNVKTVAPAVIPVIESLNWIFHVHFYCSESAVVTAATSAIGGILMITSSEYAGTERILYLM